MCNFCRNDEEEKGIWLFQSNTYTPSHPLCQTGFCQWYGLIRVALIRTCRSFFSPYDITMKWLAKWLQEWFSFCGQSVLSSLSPEGLFWVGSWKDGMMSSAFRTSLNHQNIRSDIFHSVLFDDFKHDSHFPPLKLNPVREMGLANCIAYQGRCGKNALAWQWHRAHYKTDH